ncbi:MAG: DUF4386 domain-containing protein [Ignavibacteriaceae bacterium]|jgi:hypothetical protein
MTLERKYSEATVNSKYGIVKIAGLTYIIVIVIGVFNAVFIDSRLIINEDINLTVNNIIANEFLFRFGITCELVLYVTVIILSVSLYLILKSVNRNIALFAMVLRSGEALLGITTVLIGFIVLGLLNNQVNTSSIENTHIIEALLSTRSNGLYIILFLVGLGGTLFLYLFYKSFYIPRILSVWGMLTYLSMLILSLAGILIPKHPEIIEIVLYGLGTLFEVTIGFWLLIKGIDVKYINNDNVKLK